MAKICPLYPSGRCDYPDLLESFPANFQERCASGGECLLRKVPVIGTGNVCGEDGEELNLVRARDFNTRFAYRGVNIPPLQFEQSVWNYVRGAQENG